MLTTSHLQYRYPDNERSFVFPDAHCEAGASLLVHGPSGCGKTTWMHLIAGLLRPEKGELFVAGTALHTLSPKELDAFRASTVGLVLQKPHFLAALTVQENLSLFQQLAGLRIDKSHIAELLEALDVVDQLHAKPSRLSQGQAQRIGLARALVNHPQLLLADEPTSGLDDTRTALVAKMLLEQSSKRGTTLVLVSHDARLKSFFPNEIAFS
ncbi:MAG: ATP-binding cassette domain-containing protein [Saprospiraceae bacterium]|nr:ATP-binding cassette domain-containing protein [Saprospiraceae bacterium]